MSDVQGKRANAPSIAATSDLDVTPAAWYTVSSSLSAKVPATTQNCGAFVFQPAMLACFSMST